MYSSFALLGRGWRYILRYELRYKIIVRDNRKSIKNSKIFELER